MQRLGAAENGGERLVGGADDVVLRLLGGERRPAGLGVEAQPGRLLHGVEALLHDPGPHPAGRPELGDLLEEVHVAGEEERDPPCEGVQRHAGVEGGRDVGDGVGQGEGDLLHRGAARLPHVVAGDGDDVPPGDALLAVGEEIGDEPHALAGGEDVGAAGGVLLQDVVLDRAPDAVCRHAVALGDQLVGEQQDRGGRVDGHRRRDEVEGDALEQDLHVLDRRDGDAGAPHLALGAGMVRVVAHLGGEVERHREPGLAPFQEELEALVGLLGGAEPRILAHGPEPVPVHLRVDAPGERIPAGPSEIAGRIPPPERLGAVGGLDLDPRVGEAPVLGTHPIILPAGRDGLAGREATPRRLPATGNDPPAYVQYRSVGSGSIWAYWVIL